MTRTSEPLIDCKVYTPESLADAMVAALAGDNRKTWLEPSCGNGIFIRSLQLRGLPSNRITGLDLDEDKSLVDKYGNVKRGVDFLEWSLNTRKRFDCIVGNPPYIAIRKLQDPLRSSAASVRDLNHQTIGYRANTWYAFLLRSVFLLKEGGSMSFVLPAAYEYANYSRSLSAELVRMFGRVDIIRSRRPLFSNVSDGVVVLVCKDKGSGGKLYRRHLVDNLDSTVNCLSTLDATSASGYRSNPYKSSVKRKRRLHLQLSELMNVRLGGVTGDAHYFILTESERKNYKLPLSSVRPVLSKSRQIQFASIGEAQLHEMTTSGQRVWLFCPEGKIVNNKFVQRYLQLKVESGGCLRDSYKIRNRDPWYFTPVPEIVDCFISGMSGSGTSICINDVPRLSATNTLYVGQFILPMLRRQKFAWALSMLTTSVCKQIEQSYRVYPDGLRKLEPSQIKSLDLPIPPSIPNAVSLYRLAWKCRMDGDIQGSREIADSAIA